jgi:hypothetical protein
MYPFIGEVLAGKANGTIINGTMFNRNGLVPNKLYACDNHVDPAYPDNVQVVVISEVSLVEYPQLKAVLGAPVAPSKATSTASAISAGSDAFEA